MNIVISGGGGFLGSVLVGELLNLGHKVTVIDNLMYKQDSLLQYCYNSNFNFVYGDVRDDVLLYTLADRADCIIALAAIVGMPACDKEPRLATEVNYQHVKFLTDHFPNKMHIFPQTNSGYGTGQGTSFCTEESPLNPISHYGRTKCDAEKCILSVNGISLRLATVFGVSTRPRLDLLVNHFTYEALDKGYLVLFEKDFKRNYIHVRDVANTFVFMIDNYEKCKGNVYNVGLSSANLSKYELALKIKEHISNLSIQVDEFGTDADKRNYIVSNDKIESLGWKPQYSLDDGIIELQQAYKMLFRKQQIYTNL